MQTVSAAAIFFFFAVAHSISEGRWSRAAWTGVAAAVLGFVFWQNLLDVGFGDTPIEGATYACEKRAKVDLGQDEECAALREAVLEGLPSDVAADCRQAHADVARRLFFEQSANRRVGECRVTGAVDKCKPGAAVCTLPINKGRKVSAMFWRAW